MDGDTIGDTDAPDDPDVDPVRRALCTHKHLWPPDWRDLAAILACFVVSAIAAGGGIGGGGLLLPLLIIALAMTPHDAAPLANATVLGGSLANLALNFRKRHPSGSKPLINYEVALMMEPMTMAGAIVGVLLNKVLPGWLITLMLILILGITTYRTGRRGLADWRSEAAAMARPDAAASLLPAAPIEPAHEPADKARVADGVSRSTILFDVCTLVVALSICTLLSRLRGSNRFNSLLHIWCGSLEYWALTIAQLLTLLAISAITRAVLLSRHRARVAARHRFLDDDVQWYRLRWDGTRMAPDGSRSAPASWRSDRARVPTAVRTPRSSILYPALCALAGLCAGLFGIGGGIIKGPLMLEMGMLPAVSSATSAFMILFTSAAATIQFALLGDMRPHYALTLSLVGCAGTAVGQVALNSIIKRSGRPSLIVLIIASVIGASTVIMGVTGVLTLQQELREGKSQGLRPLCVSALID